MAHTCDERVVTFPTKMLFSLMLLLCRDVGKVGIASALVNVKVVEEMAKVTLVRLADVCHADVESITEVHPNGVKPGIPRKNWGMLRKHK